MTANVRRCARCGAEVPALIDLAVTAQRTRRALETMRVALPADLTTGVRTLAGALSCYAQMCLPTIPRTP